MGEGHQRRALPVHRPRQHQRQFERAGDQGAGLQPLHPGHAAQVLAHAQHVDHLAAHHAPRARGQGQPGDQFRADVAVRMGVRMGQDLERRGLQRVARQHRGHLVIGDVDRRLPPPHLVVVHARKIVVDQAVGVDALKRAGRPQDVGLVQVEHPAGLEREEGAQALARPQRRIAHRLGQPALRTIGARQQLVQGHGDEVRRLGHTLGQFHQLNSAGSVATEPPARHPRP